MKALSLSVCIELGGTFLCVFACIEMVSSNVILKASILCMQEIESNVFVMDCRRLDFDDSSHTVVLPVYTAIRD